MPKAVIPIRPMDFVSPLTDPEQAALTWYVLSGCTKRDAYLTFARPDFQISKAKASVEDHIKQFFARKEVKEYVEAYTNTINKVLHPEPMQDKEKPKASLEERMARSRSKILEFAMDMVDRADTVSDPEMVMKIADKAGLLDVEEVAEEQPRRYLPESCSQCAYRQFCEENTEDMCPHCKYFQFGEDNGIHFDKENMLDIKIEENV